VTSTVVSIEPATAASAQVLAALHGQIFDDGQQVWNTAAFAELLAMPGAKAWIATLDSQNAPNSQTEIQPVGLALVRFAADEGEIITIGILPEYRRSGIARRLLKEIIDLAAMSRASITLEVAADNEAALLLYGRNEFLRIGRRKGYYRRIDGEKMDAIVLQRT
jgi:[ribosomal protein S18]-alanine N-acetyltransferase